MGSEMCIRDSILREQGLNEKQMRGKIDMIAASLFLQTWLDRKNEEVSHA